MNFRTIIVALILFPLVVIQSCRDDLDYPEMSTDLNFSTDTISVDTVFNYSKSGIYVLKLYNPDDKDYVIPSIKLKNGQSSYFNINVDGKVGIDFKNVPIRKKDSLYIFIDITAESAPSNPFYQDEILFLTKKGEQNVKLISWIEKAQFHASNSTINSANWNSDEAHVLEGNLSINQNLTIEEGTKVYFKKDASLIIEPNATLNVNGKLGNEVKFRTANHSTKYDSIPNQWKKIELKQGSTSTINYAKIIGAEIGLHLKKATLNISNSYVVNHQLYGILANNSTIKGFNILANNANLTTLHIENGGNYEFYQSTFANFFNLRGSAGTAYALYLSNYDTQNSNPLNTTFGNCIFYNLRTPNSIVLAENKNNIFNYTFNTSLFRNTNTTELNVLTNPNFNNSVIGDPLFENPNYNANKLRLKENSPALKVGNLIIANQYPVDYYETNRITNPSLGAIQ